MYNGRSRSTVGAIPEGIDHHILKMTLNTRINMF